MFYNPPKFLTPEVLAEVLAEFAWPSPYTLHRDPDGIEVRLPRSHLYVTEGFESDMDLAFLPESTGLDDMVSAGDAIRVLATDPDRALPPEPELINFGGGHASLDKVRNDLHDPAHAAVHVLPHVARGRLQLGRVLSRARILRMDERTFKQTVAVREPDGLAVRISVGNEDIMRQYPPGGSVDADV